MNKAIIILGSSRSNGNTKKAIDALNTDGKMAIVDLKKIKISPYDYEHKNQEDDFLGLMEKILNYDSIILATPVYWYSMSSYMKMFFDRLTDCITIRKDIGRKLEGKKVFVLSCAEHPLLKEFEAPFRETAKYMKMDYKDSFHYYSDDSKPHLLHNKKIDEFRNLIMKK
ncbi:MAG: NAD(P)H-dependent oxidoreductase [Rickettsiales bacterium]|nr:NAD(P)H-dependent oxidoreductase [Rickettsiales bacterium]